MKTIYGAYCRLGYTIYLNGSPTYSAGNSRFDSQAYTDASDGVSLRTMRRYCITTAREIASEHNGQYTGVERQDDLIEVAE
jgi:hypothetical protein